MNEPPLCKDCAFYRMPWIVKYEPKKFLKIRPLMAFAPRWMARCSHPEAILDNGTSLYCDIARKFSSMCGTNAQWFKPKGEAA